MYGSATIMHLPNTHVRNIMKIQLDTNAMNALFPEGSEARVELQAAVIANFATRIRDNQIERIVRECTGQVDQAC